jgi:hypothetical protein
MQQQNLAQGILLPHTRKDMRKSKTIPKKNPIATKRAEKSPNFREKRP